MFKSRLRLGLRLTLFFDLDRNLKVFFSFCDFFGFWGFEKLLHDICKVVAEHIRTWLERTERSQNRVNGIIQKKWAFTVAIPEV